MNYHKQIVKGKNRSFIAGYKLGITAYAWWKDGIQYVGTCGDTLQKALKAVQEQELEDDKNETM